MPLPPVDLSKGYIPLLIVVSLLTAVGVGGVYFGKTMGQLEQLSENVQSLTTSMKDMQLAIARFAPKDNWIKNDQTRFCLEAERLNSGWKCPEFE